MSRYIRLCRGLKDFGTLIQPYQVFDKIHNTNSDYYTSLFYYNQDHYNHFKKTGSVKGIKDVTTDKIWWDFDLESDVETSRQDAKKLVERLAEDYKLLEHEIEIYFSGNKGFNVVITTDQLMTPEQVRHIAIDKLGAGLKTLDPSMYDAPQVLRVAGTKHQKTGLYKIPLTIKSLFTMSVEQIKERAKSLNNIEEFNWDEAKLPLELFKMTDKRRKVELRNIQEIDWTKKPPHWRNCKYALLQGYFDSGSRHNALMVIAATCRGLGYDKETTYYMCKSALKKQASRTGSEEFPKDELWVNIIEQSIFTDGWEGGQYTCQKPGYLQEYCQSLGEHKCSQHEDEQPVVHITDMAPQFEKFAENFHENKLNFGLPTLDRDIDFLTYTSNGIVAAPGAGKTTIGLQFLNTTSNDGIPSVFLSMDMGLPIVYGKLVQRMYGCSFKEAVNLYRNDPGKRKEIYEMIKREFGNVSFNFKAGLTVPDIKDIVKAQDDLTGKKTKLLVVDYLECMQSHLSDSTASMGFISNQLKDLAGELGLCVITLLQTQKHNGTSDISDALLSMRQIKGSSVIEQSCSVIMTLWREGYNPNTIDDDRYLSMACVKNRFGGLWRNDFNWEGRRGLVTEMSEEQVYQLKDFKQRKQEMRAAEIAAKNGIKSGGWD